MRLYEIIMPLPPEELAEIDLICAPTMPADVRAEIEDAWHRAPPASLSPDEMQAMYGGDHERDELELRKLRAEVAKTEAEAVKIDAEAEDHRRGRSRSS